MKYFKGILIANCECGNEPYLHGEGTAFEEFDEDGNKNIFFVDFYGYYIDCDECGNTTYVHQTPEEAIAEWNDRDGI